MQGKGIKGRGTKRNAEKRRLIVAERYLAGVPYHEIAAETGVTVQQIGLDMKLVRQRWRDQFVVGFGEKQDRELNTLDWSETEARQAWERSKNGGAGDPRFITIVNDCVEKRCKILGLFAPQEISVGVGVFHSTPDLMEQILTRLDKLSPNIIETNGHHSGPISEAIEGLDAGESSQGDDP